MAQKILLRRGGLGSVNSGATIAVSKGEQLFASGTLANTNIENVTFIANADGNNGFQAVGRLFTGTAAADSFDSRLNGLPYYRTDTEALYRLGTATALDLTGNLEGNTVSSMFITTLSGSSAEFNGNITGSNLLLSGNANINGNIVLGGNITIGDENTDNISLGGEFTSDLIPDADDTYAVGSGARRWNLYGVNSSITGSFSGSFAGTFDSGLSLFTIQGGGQGSGTDLINTGDTITFTNASDHGFDFDITNNQISLATPQSLKTTASPTFAGATAGNIQVGVTGDNEIDTTSGNLTIDSAGGTVTVDDNLTVTGATVTLSNVPTGTDNTVLVLNSSNQVVTDEIDPRVWGTTLLDGSGTLTAGRVPYVSDANTLTDDAGLTYNAGTDVLSVGTSTFGTNVSIAGDLTVAGTTTTIDSTVVNIGDNIIVLNAAGTVADGGVQVIDTIGTAGTGSILWNATNDYWYAGVSGSTHYRLATFTNATPSTNAVPRIDANKRLVAGSITDTSTAVTISTATTLQSTLEVDGTVQLDAAGGSDAGSNSSEVVFRNSSNQIGYISTTETTDVLDGILGYKASNGALVFSTVIDGGTF
jgi:hypothetical protein